MKYFFRKIFGNNKKNFCWYNRLTKLMLIHSIEIFNLFRIFPNNKFNSKFYKKKFLLLKINLIQMISINVPSKDFSWKNFQIFIFRWNTNFNFSFSFSKCCSYISIIDDMFYCNYWFNILYWTLSKTNICKSIKKTSFKYWISIWIRFL